MFDPMEFCLAAGIGTKDSKREKNTRVLKWFCEHIFCESNMLVDLNITRQMNRTKKNQKSKAIKI